MSAPYLQVIVVAAKDSESECCSARTAEVSKPIDWIRRKSDIDINIDFDFDFHFDGDDNQMLRGQLLNQAASTRNVAENLRLNGRRAAQSL